jgi:hypothetical protein
MMPDVLNSNSEIDYFTHRRDNFTVVGLHASRQASRSKRIVYDTIHCGHIFKRRGSFHHA